MTGSRIDKWIRPEVRGLQAYHVPPAKGLIKLDAMENPYRWPEPLLDQWLDVVRQVELNRYPDPAAASLKQHLREAMAVPEGAEILLGNGSDEIIQMILMTLADEQRTVLSVEPGFVMYHMIATFTDMQYIGVPLQDDFSLDTKEILHAIEQYQPAVVFLAYPNNPTGNLFDKNDVKKIIDAAPGLVIIDEAYHAFAGDSFMNEVTHYDNMLVMRTVSKMGLAGLRLGLLAGNPAWLNEFDKVRLPYNISSLTQASAEFALQNRDVLNAQTDQICTDRESLFAELNKIDGLSVYPSKANFILFRTQPGKATDIFEALKGEGVLIKNLDKTGGLLKDCLRVTVGTPEENAAFLAALKK
ncbi:MAG: histidinol-phosphate transaminase, partial [Thiohalophilus sp.]|uniref:histidinol-phosphate transaminase n=1 Tax=Thiohalophilus sp. TaxID=3028392 RepID=UPI002870635F